jgi:hypothetical protein
MKRQGKKLVSKEAKKQRSRNIAWIEYHRKPLTIEEAAKKLGHDKTKDLAAGFDKWLKETP